MASRTGRLEAVHRPSILRSTSAPGKPEHAWPASLRSAHRHDVQSVQSQRRRWESNPLEPGCSRSPGRLAPASRKGCPRQELNLVLDLRRVVCESVTLRGRDGKRIPRPGIEPGLAASKTAVRPIHSRGAVGPVPSPGVEPGPRPSEGRVRFRHTPRATNEGQQGCKDSNPVGEFWRLAALPGAHPSSF